MASAILPRMPANPFTHHLLGGQRQFTPAAAFDRHGRKECHLAYQSLFAQDAADRLPEREFTDEGRHFGIIAAGGEC